MKNSSMTLLRSMLHEVLEFALYVFIFFILILSFFMLTQIQELNI